MTTKLNKVVHFRDLLTYALADERVEDGSEHIFSFEFLF